jgi:hypothetical protein
VKLKNIQIFYAREILDKIKDSELPVKIAYKLAKIINKIDEQYLLIDNQRNTLVKKYGKEENGQIYVQKDDTDNFDKFLEDFNELLEIEEDIEVEQFSIDDLEKVNLSINELNSIEFLIKED